jgi:hypothetical protein
MSRISIPFSATDVSALARSLRSQLEQHASTPGHVELLNMLARSIGHRNFQSLRAQFLAQTQLGTPPPAPVPVDSVQVRQAVRHFDSEGRLSSWPAKPTLQSMCLWALWSKLPPRVGITEADLNRLIRRNHSFADHALLRRELCDQGLLTRTADGREYRRVERQPSPEGLALLRFLKGSAK